MCMHSLFRKGSHFVVVYKFVYTHTHPSFSFLLLLLLFFIFVLKLVYKRWMSRKKERHHHYWWAFTLVGYRSLIRKLGGALNERFVYIYIYIYIYRIDTISLSSISKECKEEKKKIGAWPGCSLKSLITNAPLDEFVLIYIYISTHLCYLSRWCLSSFLSFSSTVKNKKNVYNWVVLFSRAQSFFLASTREKGIVWSLFRS
jgi:hypothetical protein